jgi:Flp pilus assembly protein TadD
MLALALACLTYHQTGVWTSDERLWTQAAHVAPSMPRPLINLALVRLRAGDLDGAERDLRRAAVLAEAQPTGERLWAMDVIAATRAQVLMQHGRFREASALIYGARPATARGKVCSHFRTVCELAANSASWR